MKLPVLPTQAENIEMIDQFMGVDFRQRISESSFSDMRNVTNDYFPTIGNRKERGIVRTLENPQGILGGQYLTYVDDDKLYYDEQYVCDLDANGGERQLVMLGAYICVFPDGIIYNTLEETTDTVRNTRESEANECTFTLCRLDGTNYDSSNTVTSNTEPSDTTKYWLDTSADPVVLKKYSDSTSSWNSVGTTYVRVGATDIGKGFSAYDAAKFSGIDANRPEIYNGQDFNQTNLIYDAGDDFVVIAGLINLTFTNVGKVKIERELPEMDFICEQNNRIWGCSSERHEIYACKLGDPKNWNCFAGLSSDSYAATVGTQGAFTGCVSYSGTVFFFKENGFHRLYGEKPSNFQLMWKPGRGVQEGSSKSIAIVGDYLYYKSRDAVCVYDGATEDISEALGGMNLYDAVGGAYRTKYYVKMRDEDLNIRLYVYDTMKGTWVIEDELKAIYMTAAANALYIIDADGVLYVVNKEKILIKWFPSEDIFPSEDLYPGNYINGSLEDKIEWSLTTGDMEMEIAYQKYVKRLMLRVELEENALLRIEISYDSLEDWRFVGDFMATKKRSYNIPVPVQRCDHYRIRFSGQGNFKIYSLTKVFEGGGDIHV